MPNRLAIILQEKGITQETIASALKFTPATVSRWCSNLAQPSIDKLYLLASFLKLDISKLLYGETRVIKFRKELQLKVLDTDDAFLQMIMGSSDLLKLQKASLFFETKFPDGSSEAYPLSLLGYTNLYRPTHISLIEIGVIIDNCRFTTLTAENIDEDLRITFMCPSPSILKAK